MTWPSHPFPELDFPNEGPLSLSPPNFQTHRPLRSLVVADRPTSPSCSSSSPLLPKKSCIRLGRGTIPANNKPVASPPNSGLSANGEGWSGGHVKENLPKGILRYSILFNYWPKAVPDRRKQQPFQTMVACFLLSLRVDKCAIGCVE